MQATRDETSEHLPLPLRRAIGADAAAIAALVNSAYRGDSSRAGWTTEADLLGGQRTDAEAVAAIIAAPDDVVLVHEGALTGAEAVQCCVHLERTDAGCYLGMLTVRPTLQAGGVGRRLLASAEAWAAEHWGSARVYMTVIAQRPELIAWYERRGYARTGERQPFPYGDARFGLPRREDLVFEVLAKQLG
jgi:GNAT superfamily N-acetyltransferase